VEDSCVYVSQIRPILEKRKKIALPTGGSIFIKLQSKGLNSPSPSCIAKFINNHRNGRETLLKFNFTFSSFETLHNQKSL
jgi:hypothetical protein